VGGQCGPRYQAFRREELEEVGIKWGRMEEAFEEGQGPHRAVVPMMMMMMIMTMMIRLNLSGERKFSNFVSRKEFN
jgi:hypothetical protein